MSTTTTPKPDHHPKLFVGGLRGKAWTSTAVRDAFLPFGSILDVALPKEGMALVSFEREQDAEEAEFNMNGAEICKCVVRVEKSGARR